MRLPICCIFFFMLLLHSVLSSPYMSFNKGPDPWAKLAMTLGMGPGAAPTRPDMESQETTIMEDESVDVSPQDS